MTEKEKNAIETLIEIKEFSKLSSYLDVKTKQLNAIDIVTNLIEKQQKEIEKVKENYDELFTKYEMKKILFVRKDHETNELISDLYIRKDILNADYISKDKIKEKIKELSKTQAYKVGLEEYTIKILNELLEE